MATRHHQAVVSEHQRGDAVPTGKQKAAAAAAAGKDGKNRRALGDIGNLVNLRGPDGKPLYHQINRPVTRSFGAQLLANAQAAAAAGAAANNKPVAVVANAVAPKPVAKAAKTKAPKPKPEAATIVIPDSSKEQLKPDTETSTRRNSSRKKVHTFTSVLNARSKAACGVADKPKDPIQDIDALDADNQLAVVDYVEDIYKFYKLSENSSRPHDYMHSQVEINEKMRAILADWLIEVHHKFDLMPETLYLTFYIIDKFLSMEEVSKRDLQLVGVSSMLIACKYEEIWAPEVNDFICISDRAYTREEILAEEKAILTKLEWNLTVPTPYVFLVRFLKAGLCVEEMEHLVFFFAELGLLHYPMIVYCPSMVAASAVYAARCTLKKAPVWTETLRRHTGFTEAQLMDCAKVLVSLHSAAAASKLKVVYRKYSNAELGAVAVLPPATKMMEEMSGNKSV